MAVEKISASEFAKWVLASEAAWKLGTICGSRATGITALLTRLSVGWLRSAAEHAVITQHGQKPIVGDLVVIPPVFWECLKGLEISHSNDLWSVNDLDIEIENRDAGFRAYGWAKDHFQYFSVRFDPIGFQKLLPRSPEPDNEGEEEPPPAKNDSPPVSASDLAQWYGVFKRAYGGGPNDTLANAWASAKGMFPDKFVSRDSVRKLTEGEQRTRGRKPKVSAK